MRNRAAEMEAGITAKQNKALAMQEAIASKQQKRGLFSRENLRAQGDLNNLTREHALRTQRLNNYLKTRSTLEEKLKADIGAREAADLEAGKAALRKQGFAAQALGGQVRSKLKPMIEARSATQLAEGMAPLIMKQEQLALQVERSESAIEGQRIAMAKSASAQKAFAAGIESDRAALESLNHQIRRDQAALAEFNAERARYERTAPRVARLERLRAGAQGLAAAGRTAMFAGGVGAVGLGFAATSAARLATESSLAATQAITSIQQVGKVTEQVQQGILSQMQKFPASADEMAKSIYEIFSGTNIQNSQKGLQLMATFNKAAVAGQSDLNTATQGGITVMNAYNKGVKDIIPIEQKMFSAVRFGRTTFTDFNNALNQLVPAFKSANQSIDTMFGSLAFLTRRMPSVRQASVALARATEILANPKMIEGLKKAGVNISDVHGNLLDLPVVLGRILKQYPELAKGKNVMQWVKELSNQTGTIQARKALTFLFRQFPQYSQMLKQVSGDTNEFTRSYKVMSQTPQVKLNVAINQFKALAIAIGKDAIPAIIQLLGPLTEAGTWFHNLSPGVKQTIATLAVFSSALLLVGGSLAVVIGGLTSMYATLRIAALVSTAATAFGELAAGIALVSEALAAGEIAAALGLIGGGLVALLPYVAVAAAIAGGFYILTRTVHTTQDAIADVNKSLEGLKGRAADIGKINKAVDSTNKIMSDLTTNTREAQKANTGAGWKGTLFLKQNTKDAANQMHQLTNQTQHEVELLSQIAAAGEKVAKQAAGRGAVTLAKDAGLGARQQQNVAFISRMTGRLPTAELLGRFQEFGDKAIGIVATVAQATHKMMTGHELDTALKLNQGKLQRLFEFVQSHHKLPKWFLTLETKQADDSAKRVHSRAQMLAKQRFKVHFQDGTGPAMKGVSKLHLEAMHTIQQRYKLRFAIDTGPVTTALGTLVGQAEIAGQNIASALHNGFAGAKGIKSGSPSKVFMKEGKNIIDGIKLGMVKEAGGVQAAFKSIIGTMSSEWSSLLSTMQSNAGTLFQGPRGDIISSIMGFGAKPGIGLLTQDLRAQTHKFSTWIHAVDRLRSMGAPPALVAQLWEMGPDSLPAVQSILAATKRQRKTYFGIFRRQQRLVRSGTQRAFLNETRIWKNMGKSAAFGLLTGLHDVKPELLRFFKGLAHEMFPTHHRGHGGGGGGQKHVHYHYHAPNYVAGTSHRAHMRKSRFDYERHVRGLPA